MKIIVNADDFGRSSTRNEAINYSMLNGYCSQTSLMVNMGETTDDAVELAERNGYMDKICLHLNLTLGKPLSEKITGTSFCDENGSFKFSCVNDVFKTLMHNMRFKDILAIREECEAQIKKYLDYGFTQRHIDSHNWVHLHLPVWIALHPLLKRYKFRSIRPMRPNLRKTGRKKFRLYYIFFNFIEKNSKFTVNNYSSGLEEFMDYKRRSNDNDVYEIFTHPDIIDNVLLDCSYSYKGNSYTEMKNVHNILSAYNTTLTYNDIN